VARFFLLLALTFSPLAAIMAFLIVYDEYRHHFPERKTPLKIACKAALATYIVFVIALILIYQCLSVLE